MSMTITEKLAAKYTEAVLKNPKDTAYENILRATESLPVISAAPEMAFLLGKINETFYVKNSSKALREVMALTKPLLQKVRGEG